MDPTEGLRIKLTESQAERLQRQLATLPFKVGYQEEQHGATLVVIVRCTPSQEKIVREILNELGAAVPSSGDE